MALLALGLGSNLGNRVANLRLAAAQVSETIGPIRDASDIFETAPWGVTDQPFFLNACLTVETDASPQTLLTKVKFIEREMGRKKTVRWGARLIDLDLLLLDDLIHDEPYLRIPHPHLHERDFVLIPLAQILPGWRHPTLGKTIEEMAAGLKTPTPPLRIVALLL